ncbi:hypothetical protein Tco_0621703 [Tanacetum coccineum]
MSMGKWSRINGDCQKFNAIYKHLTRKSGENEADHIENAKDTYMERCARPAGKPRSEKKAKLVDTSSVGGAPGGSQSESLTGVISQDYRRKCEAAEAAHEAKRKKELGLLECRELEFLMTDPSLLPPEKAAYIQRKQDEIMKKYPNA